MFPRFFTIVTIFALSLCNISFAQTTAMDFNRKDCNGQIHHLFADLDSGKAVILFYFMPSCGSCPPPAKKIQTMSNNLSSRFPGKIKAYVMPFNNSTKCQDVGSWVSSNSVYFYTPLDSGASQVAYYGGFGMPTVVLLGGKNHRVMFSSLSFSTSDTTEMKDSIVALITGKTSGIESLPGVVSSFSMFPNPSSDVLNIGCDVKENTHLVIDISDIGGKQLAIIMDEKCIGKVSCRFNTSTLPNGHYLVRLNANGVSTTRKVEVIH